MGCLGVCLRLPDRFLMDFEAREGFSDCVRQPVVSWFPLPHLTPTLPTPPPLPIHWESKPREEAPGNHFLRPHPRALDRLTSNQPAHSSPTCQRASSTQAKSSDRHTLCLATNRQIGFRSNPPSLPFLCPVSVRTWCGLAYMERTLLLTRAATSPPLRRFPCPSLRQITIEPPDLWSQMELDAILYHQAGSLIAGIGPTYKIVLSRMVMYMKCIKCLPHDAKEICRWHFLEQ